MCHAASEKLYWCQGGWSQSRLAQCLGKHTGNTSSFPALVGCKLIGEDLKYKVWACKHLVGFSYQQHLSSSVDTTGNVPVRTAKCLKIPMYVHLKHRDTYIVTLHFYTLAHELLPGSWIWEKHWWTCLWQQRSQAVPTHTAQQTSPESLGRWSPTDFEEKSFTKSIGIILYLKIQAIRL